MVHTLALHDSGVPIYVQIREQMLRAIAEGLAGPGDQMPTMRQVAVALRIDLNTVRHAYEELERLGAIVLMRGRGSFVAAGADARAAAWAEVGADPRVGDPADRLANRTLAAAAAAGVDPREVARRITDLLDQSGAER